MIKLWTRIFWSTAIIAVFCSASAQALVILQYHHIANDTPAITSTDPLVFGQQLDHLIEAGIAVVSLPEALQANPASNQAGRPIQVAITFDDAYPSVFDTALPMLKARGMPFTLFVATDLVGAAGGGYLSWDQIKELKAAGGTIANHSTQHQHWARIPSDTPVDEWIDAFVDDTLTAQATLDARLGEGPKLYALPYGEYFPALAEALRALGFAVFGQQSGAMSLPPQAVIPRFPMGGRYSDIAQFKTKVKSLAFPIQPVAHDPRLTALESRPIVNLKQIAKTDLSTITCFGPEGRLHSEAVGHTVLVSASTPIPPGRARYNCTQMSTQPGRFYWHSFFWMKLQADNTWYPER